MSETMTSTATLTAAPATAPPRRGKDAAIESLRGLAIVMMVAGHVIGSTGEDGMRVADDSLWRTWYLVFEDIRMPLFATISGVVYGLRPLRSMDAYPQLVRGKVKRLLVPLVVVGTTFAVVQTVMPGTNNVRSIGSIWRLYLYGTFHFWFLWAIFGVFLLVGVLDGRGLLQRPGWRAGVLAAAVAAFVLVRVPPDANLFSFNGFLRLLPFFLVGYYLPLGWRMRPRVSVALLAVTLALIAVRTATALGPGELPAVPDRALALAIGTGCVVLLLAHRERLRTPVLARMGVFAFGVYLLHVFGSAGSRLLAERLGLAHEVPVFLLGMTCAIGLPVLVEVLFGRYAWVSWPVLGQKPRSYQPAAPSRLS